MIRDAGEADRDALRALHLASWRANYGVALPEAYLREVLPGVMAEKWAAFPLDRSAVTLVADGEDGIGGFVRADVDPVPPLIDNLHTRPGLYGRGIGAALLRAARDRLAARGFARCWLTVLERNPRALAFYRREGGVEEDAYEEDFLGFRVRVRRIGFATMADPGFDPGSG